MATFASGTCLCPRYFYDAYGISNITPASFIELSLGTAHSLFLYHYLRGLVFLVYLVPSTSVCFKMLARLSPYGHLGSYTCAVLVRALALKESRDSC